MDAFTIEVGYTDRSRADGAFVSWPCVVTVLAANEVEAHLVASQMVEAIRHEAIDGQVTYSRTLDVTV